VRQRTDLDLITLRFEVWEGNNMFYCDGRVIAGPEIGSFLCTTSLIVIPKLVFFFIIVPTLLACSQAFWISAILGVAGFCGMVGSLTCCYCTDPGIIPRGPKELREQHSRGPRIVEKQDEDGNKVAMRRCDTCGIYKPPRTHHCRDCGNCVEVFDHHCPWVGTCIAKRNYRFFVSFLFSVTLSLLHVFLMGAVTLFLHISEEDLTPYLEGLYDSIPLRLVTMGLMGYCGFLFLPLSCLASYHLFIISNGETTKEEVRKVYEGVDNPNDRGCLANWKEAFCKPLPPSKLDFLRDIVEDSSVCGEEDDGSELTPFTADTSEDVSSSGFAGALMGADLQDKEEVVGQVCPGLPRVMPGNPRKNPRGAQQWQALPQTDGFDMEAGALMAIEMEDINPVGDGGLGTWAAQHQDSETVVWKPPSSEIEMDVGGVTMHPERIARRLQKVDEEEAMLQQYFSSSPEHAAELGGCTMSDLIDMLQQDENFSVDNLAEWVQQHTTVRDELLDQSDGEGSPQIVQWELEFSAAVILLKRQGYPLFTNTDVAFGQLLLEATEPAN